MTAYFWTIILYNWFWRVSNDFFFVCFEYKTNQWSDSLTKITLTTGFYRNLLIRTRFTLETLNAFPTKSDINSTVDFQQFKYERWSNEFRPAQNNLTKYRRNSNNPQGAIHFITNRKSSLLLNKVQNAITSIRNTYDQISINTWVPVNFSIISAFSFSFSWPESSLSHSTQ